MEGGGMTGRRRRSFGVMMTASLASVAALSLAADPSARAQTPPTAAKIDTQPLELVPPERYHLPSTLEPVRRVTLVAASDGIVRSQDAREGADVRANQEVAQLDKAEATALLKIARAEAKEWKATAEFSRRAFKTGEANARDLAQAEAKLEAAEARVELAQAALDRCTLRAPFAGRLLESFVSDGQYVAKGAVIAELADVSSLRAFVPLTRAGATVGSTVPLTVEGQPVQGKLQALLPLSESFGVLRELLTPMAGAWVVVPNTGGTLEPGQRVVSPALPASPVSLVPAQAVQNHEGKQGLPSLQVIRNEYVVNVPVRVLGSLGSDRVQVTGALRKNDALIVSSSVPLLAGTLIRFNGARGGAAGSVEGTTPNPAASGVPADVSPPAGTGRPRVGLPPAANPTQTPPATGKPAAKAGGSVPF